MRPLFSSFSMETPSLNLGRNFTAVLRDNITFRQALLWRKEAPNGSPTELTRAMVLDAVILKRGEHETMIAPAQYDAMPMPLVVQLTEWLGSVLFQNATPEKDDPRTLTLPSGLRVRYRTALVKDQLAAEKWCKNEPQFLISYLIEQVCTFWGEEEQAFVQWAVEDIWDLSVTDGYALMDAVMNEEKSENFFEDFLDGLLPNSQPDSSGTGSRSRKSKE